MKHDDSIHVLLTAEEKRLVRAVAEHEGLSPSSWVRRQIRLAARALDPKPEGTAA